jgi:hypothetical protein
VLGAGQAEEDRQAVTRSRALPSHRAVEPVVFSTGPAAF